MRRVGGFLTEPDRFGDRHSVDVVEDLFCQCCKNDKSDGVRIAMSEDTPDDELCLCKECITLMYKWV